jgi:hypothetical protein
MKTFRSGVLVAWVGAIFACSGGSSDASGKDDPLDPGDCTPIAQCATSWCGPHDDGCGGTLDCAATCAGSEVCGGFTPGVCSPCTADGVCAVEPDPWKGGYTHVFGTSATDVWALDVDDPIFEWDGAVWTERTSTAETAPDRGFANGPARVWGMRSTRMWGVSAWGVFEWNGTKWSFVEGRFGPLYGIWGTSETDVWAVGAGGMIIHFDGTAWSQRASGTTEILLDVWASTPDDAWAVGQNGVLLRWRGTEWTRPFPVTTPIDYRVVQAIGGDQALVITEDGEIVLWNGTAIETWALGQTGMARDLWAFGLDDVWRVGEYGIVQHWNGEAWTTYESGKLGELYAVWGSPNGDVWIAPGDREMLRIAAAR